MWLFGPVYNDIESVAITGFDFLCGFLNLPINAISLLLHIKLRVHRGTIST